MEWIGIVFNTESKLSVQSSLNLEGRWISATDSLDAHFVIVYRCKGAWEP